MLTVYFVRHGETEASRDGRMSGDADPPLTDLGLRMADALGAAYGRWPWAALYTSPRLRARQTADAIARPAGLRVNIEDGLREIAYGAWEGVSEAELATRPEFHTWAADPARVAPPGGETAVEVASRATAALDAIRARHRDGQVLAVSHKATIRILVCALLGIELARFRDRIGQPVAAVSAVEFRPSGPLLKLLGDTSHLPPDLRAQAR